MINKDSITAECNALATTLIKKNHDYGNSVQDQFNEYGLTSILIRLDDKMKRLKTLRTLDPQVADESLKDTLQDLAGYSILGLLCLKQQEQTIEPLKISDKATLRNLDTIGDWVTRPINVPTEDWIKHQQIKENLFKKAKYMDIDDV